MDEYYSIKINDNLELQSLPLLLQGFTPNLDRLPQFLMRLGPEASSPTIDALSLISTQVDWSQEVTCLEGIARELAFFYRPGSLADVLEATVERADSSESEAQMADKWQIEHVVFPAMRDHLWPPKALVEQSSTVTQIANLPDLYRVFERC